MKRGRCAAAAARATCSPSTSTGEGVDDTRVVHLFERLYDDAIAEAAG